MSNNDIDIRHQITVRELQNLLNDLRDDLILIPNTVGNLIISDGSKHLGFIDLLKDQSSIEYF